MAEIIQQQSCPWCGSTGKTPLDDVSRRRNTYISALAQSADVTEESIMETEAYQCDDCRTIYLASFFDKLSVGRAFAEKTSSHNAGWTTFHAKTGLLPTRKARQWRQKDRLKRELLGMLPAHDGLYVEVGCPFTGLIHEQIYGADGDSEVSARYFGFLEQTIATNTAAFASFIGRGGGMLSLWGNGFRRALSRRARRATPDKAALERAEARARSIFLVKPDSRYIWGQNCTSNFASCTATVLAVYGVQRIRMEEISEIAGGRPVTIGFYNTLDHLEEPRALLEQAMEIADHVVIETHGHTGGGGRQHPFFLHQTIPAWAERRGWALTDHSEGLQAANKGYRNHFYILGKAE